MAAYSVLDIDVPSSYRIVEADQATRGSGYLRRTLDDYGRVFVSLLENDAVVRSPRIAGHAA